MIPAGYMAKKVATCPDWIAAAGVEDIFSLSNCISPAFADYIGFWRHNGFWLFNSVSDLENLARDENIDLCGMTIFYYELFEKEYDEHAKTWADVSPDEAFPMNVEPAGGAKFAGFDVTTFFARASPECSPLSCNAIAREVPVNRHCLFSTLEQATAALEDGKFGRSEPGPFRIFAVYTV